MGRPKKWITFKVLREVVALRLYIIGEPMPLLEDFCVNRGYSRQRWYDWLNNSEFSDTVQKNVKEAMEMCRNKFTVAMIKGGLRNELNKTMAIFCLKNVAGWRDDKAAINVSSVVQTGVNESSEGIKEPLEEAKERLKRNLGILKRYGFLESKEFSTQ